MSGFAHGCDDGWIGNGEKCYLMAHNTEAWGEAVVSIQRFH